MNVYSGEHGGGAWASRDDAPLWFGWLADALVRSHGETKQSMVEQAAISVIELVPRLTISVCRGHGSPPQCEAAQHVVGECEPQQHGAGLVCAAHIKPSEAHAARPGIGAFGLRALLVELFAGLARHAPTPVRHPRFVVAPRRKGIGAMLNG